MAVTKVRKSPDESWRHLIGNLQSFRQQRYEGTKPKTPGRSKWPEPDEIRRLTGHTSPKHSREVSTIRKFPRGAMGLPIVFHFKDEREGDPPTTTLQGSTKGYDRFASPVILRPLACQGGQSVGIALILEGTQVFKIPGGLALKAEGQELYKVEAAQLPPLKGNPDVLEAFLDFIVKNP